MMASSAELLLRFWFSVKWLERVAGVEPIPLAHRMLGLDLAKPWMPLG